MEHMQRWTLAEVVKGQRSTLAEALKGVRMTGFERSASIDRMSAQEAFEDDRRGALQVLSLDQTASAHQLRTGGLGALSVETMEARELQARAVAAKLSLPHTGFVLTRPRLCARVEALRSGGLVLLVAGPGYGKTTFMVDLLSRAEGRTAYLALDEDDRKPRCFLGYLAAALGMALADETLAPGLEWSLDGTGALGSVELAARLVEHVRARGNERTLLAIDDLHLVDGSRQVMEGLEFLIRGAPPGWTILLGSRRRPPLNIDRVTLSGRLIELGSRELRLTPKEVACWALQNWRVSLGVAETRALWRATQGWPAALALLGRRVLTANRGKIQEDLARILSHGDMDSYLEEGIFSDVAPSTAEILLAASLLPQVIFPRDESFLGGAKGEAEAVLQEFASHGWLVNRLAARSYSVHPLVRGLAERRAGTSVSCLGLLKRAGRHLEDVGALQRSVTCYLEAGCFEDAARVIRLLAVASPNPASSWANPEWMRLIPEPDWDHGGVPEGAWPWLITAKARVLHEKGNYSQAGLLYEEAARLIAAGGDKEGLLPVLLCSAACLFGEGRWEESLAVMDRCRNLVRSPAERSEVLVMEGGILVALCRCDEAVENWEKALLIAPADLRPVLAPRVHHLRGRLFYLLGHYRAARNWAEKALVLASIRRPGSVAHAQFLDSAAIIACLSGDYERAERLAGECERMVLARGYGMLEATCLLTQAAIAAGKANPRAALVAMRKAQDLAAKNGEVETSYWAEDMLGEFCRRHKNAERALDHHHTALEIAQGGRLGTLEKVQAKAALGMDLMALGEETEARPLLEEAIQLSRQWRLMNPLAPALFYLGWLEAKALREQEAARALAECLQIAGEHDHIYFFSQEARVAVPILALCERLRAGSFVRERIVPLLPDNLRTLFFELAQGRIYPTEVRLGSLQRDSALRPAGKRMAEVSPALSPDSSVLAAMESLTEREWAVLEMLAAGLPNKVIGAKLFITEKTVKTHTNHIFRKLGVANRLQAVLLFQKFQRVCGGKGGRPGSG